MKQLLLAIGLILLLSGCALPNEEQVFHSEGAVKEQTSAKRKKPRIPPLRQLKASLLEHGNKEAEKEEEKEDVMDRLLDEIDEKLSVPTITAEDIRRGWYYGSEEEKRYGTQNSWYWTNEDGEPRWVSPYNAEEKDLEKPRELCRQTAGTYVISCIESDIPDCKHIPESECRCIEGSVWQDGQGCLLTDEEGELLEITTQELRQGWYYGLPNEKKLNTPKDWIWQEAGKKSRWQNPLPSD